VAKKIVPNIWHTLPQKSANWTDEANNMMKEKADYLPLLSHVP